jgi:hypothetical protein
MVLVPIGCPKVRRKPAIGDPALMEIPLRMAPFTIAGFGGNVATLFIQRRTIQ